VPANLGVIATILAGHNDATIVRGPVFFGQARVQRMMRLN
jgi:hypothetical protein